MVEEFPSNSNEKRDARTRPAPKTEGAKAPKKIEKIIEGEAVQRKKPLGKRFKNMFFGGNAREALGFAAVDVLLPAARDMLADAGRETIERLIFGESRRSRVFARSGGPTRYDGYYRGGSSPYGAPAWRREPQRDISPRGRSTHSFDEIVLDSRGEAEQVIDTLFEIVQQYNQATVSDLYGLVGITSAYTDQKYGWTDLRGANVQHTRGGYLLNLPKPEPLD